MRVYTKYMTSWQALSCERAKQPKCVCRCGGALHGKNHDAFLREVNYLINHQGEVSEEEIRDILVDMSYEAARHHND